MGLSAGAAIRENPGSALLVLAAAASAAAAAAASTTTALPCLFTFGHFSYWYDRNITAVVMASVGTGFASHCCIPWYE